jgi:hypothetical protein
MPEDEMTPEQLREALRLARRVRTKLLTPAILLFYPQREAEAFQRVKQESVKRERVELVDDDDEVTVVSRGVANDRTESRRSLCWIERDVATPARAMIMVQYFHGHSAEILTANAVLSHRSHVRHGTCAICLKVYRSHFGSASTLGLCVRSPSLSFLTAHNCV